MANPDDWAPDACTLPTAERPLRIAEFDELFGYVVRADRVASQRLDLTLPYAVEPAARDLARRESECCSFFAFDFTAAGKHVVMHIAVREQQVEVLDTVEARVSRS